MITGAMLETQLQALGVRPGALLMVHASMRRAGPVAGGADTVLDALQTVLGPAGTLVMVLGARADAPFDAQRAPADPEMGILAEVFRRRPATGVNDHAAARFGASGPLAADLLANIPLHDYHGPGSLIARFTEAGGEVLRLGADDDTITVTHWAEYLANLPLKRRVRIAYQRADIGTQWIEGLDDTHGIVDWEHGDYFSRIWLDYRAAGHPVIGPVGNCTAELFPAAHFVGFACRWMEAHLGRGAIRTR
jgi:aminoglycoside N3'-acetyltransferase